MVEVAGARSAIAALRASFKKTVVLGILGLVVLSIFYTACTTRVAANEFGVEQTRVGLKQGIRDRAFEAGLYFIPFGSTMHTFPREIHVLEASADLEESLGKARSGDQREKVERYFENRDRVLGSATHRVIEALNIQTSDGYAVTADLTLLYAIDDPVRIAKDFGWGTLYVDSFCLNTFRNGVLTTLGKMNAEEFYNERARISAVAEAETSLRQRFGARGFRVEKLLLRNYKYAPNYEKSLHDKKVAVQVAVQNKRELLVNEEKAKLQQRESEGNATITIEESRVHAEIAKIQAEASLYSSQVRAKGDKEVNVAVAEAKRLKADALTQAGGRNVVALETARMFDNIDGAVMTPEQYIQFVRNAWSLIGVSSPAPGAPGGGR